jgi:Ras-related GTP-binding protein C/D
MYELCADLVDVVIDVSYIYGVNQLSPDSPSKKPNKESKHRTDNHQNGSSLHAILEAPYDEASTSAIKLNNGMVLYLRYVSDYLALVCIIRENYFARRSLLDYNIDCLKASLFKVIQVAKGL